MTKEDIRKYNKLYYKKNKEKILEQKKEYNKQWRLENAERRREYNKQWRLENAEQKKEYNKRYRKDNVERIREQEKQYYQNNKNKRLKQQKEYRQTPMGRASYLLSNYNQADKKQNRGQGDLTAKWIVENIFTKPCAHCGKTGWDIIGCNRLDNSKPHTMDNVEPCCLECNISLPKKG